MRRLFRTAVVLATVLGTGQASAVLLVPGTEAWGKKMGDNPARMYQDSANTVVGTPSNTLQLSMNPGFDGLTITGQAIYTWTLGPSATNVAELAISDDEMYTTADIDPSFTSLNFVSTVQMDGYILSNDADWELELWMPGHVWVPFVTPASVAWSPTTGTQGTAVNFNETLSTPPGPYRAAPGDKFQLHTVGFGLWLKVRPPGGAKYFQPNSTVSIVVDFPLIGTGSEVPEPSGTLLLGLMGVLGAATVRRRR